MFAEVRNLKLFFGSVVFAVAFGFVKILNHQTDRMVSTFEGLSRLF